MSQVRSHVATPMKSGGIVFCYIFIGVRRQNSLTSSPDILSLQHAFFLAPVGTCYFSRSFCKKHSKNRKESAANVSSPEKRGKRQNLIKELGDEFYTFVNPSVSK